MLVISHRVPHSRTGIRLSKTKKTLNFCCHHQFYHRSLRTVVLLRFLLFTWCSSWCLYHRWESKYGYNSWNTNVLALIVWSLFVGISFTFLENQSQLKCGHSTSDSIIIVRKTLMTPCHKFAECWIRYRWHEENDMVPVDLSGILIFKRHTSQRGFAVMIVLWDIGNLHNTAKLLFIWTKSCIGIRTASKPNKELSWTCYDNDEWI